MSDQFTAHRTDHVLYLHWARGAEITLPLAVEAARILEGLAGGEILPLIVVMGGIDGVAIRARMGMNAYRGFARVALVGDGPVDEVLAGFAHASATSTHYFTSESQALAWIRDSGDDSEESAA
ncbi:hypothetical protein AC792_10530 [Arthrobacter sp. RIT-PI-e]|uniref:DUF7793 family protein n=1 Tax=Arthrobacter sp. RIT-PI-e TaxID=1681197 RepID=UPI000676AEC3|nr:STAS/SEC14 domain-containing protein [Arthrobacter sp. RIT-PI-e]KNC18721.1 hypothetical protein AC792_10530 [Arthrobacter sp. RIT-PI-e]